MTARRMAAGLIFCASLVRIAAASPIFQVNALNGTDDLVITDNTGTSNTATLTNTAVIFNFDVPTALGPAGTTYDGTISFSAATSSPAVLSGSTYDQSNWATTATATVTCTNCASPYNNQVIFSFTFGPSGMATYSTATPGTAGTLSDTQPPPSEVSFSSPLVNFTGVLGVNFTLTAGNAPLGGPWATGSGGYIASNVAHETITFSGTAATPEPGTFVLIGCALAGAGLIGKKRFSPRDNRQ